MGSNKAIYRFELRERGPGGPREAGIPADARALGIGIVRRARCAQLYFVEGTIAPEELCLLGRSLFGDSVSQDCVWRRIDEVPPVPADLAVVEVTPRPGVSDPVAAEILRAARELGLRGLEAAATGTRWELEGEGLAGPVLERLTRRLLANPLVERWALGEIEPAFAAAPAAEAGPAGGVERFELAALDDEGLLALSRQRRTALDLPELRAIRAYFAAEGRPATDLELEMLAQTWSEHCVHKTFRALVEVEAPRPHPYPELVDGILNTYIRSATEEIAAPWVLSAFVDNAGIVELDAEHEVSFKVETHNHPSAVEPFGGANTGLGGVIRDIMGVSARPIAATDVLCFGPLDAPPESLPEGLLHPRLIARGVVAGIEDYGNKMGIPTVNGAVHYDPGYAANPLVYCGCAGLSPRGLHRTEPKVGDRIVVLGGRTGRDGIRGATFSSMSMDGETGEVAGASVQIGDPITQKRALDVLLGARDLGLYDAVTDCGAGGLSSAVGEMAGRLGAEVDLDLVGRKYPGLAPWEVWLSEAQERMVLAVPPGKLARLEELCELHEAERWDIGSITGTGRILLRAGGEPVLELSADFLKHGLPRKRLKACPPSATELEALRPRPAGRLPAPGEALLGLLSAPNLSSKEAIVRRYDHEVQGGTVVRPFAGREGDAPSDAAVIKPQGTAGEVAIVLSNGFRPDYGRLDPYRMAWSVVDEAIRNAVAVGADPARIAILDNFCLGDPGRPEVMWSLLEAARGCRDAALAFAAPFISGKDSFYNEYLGPDGRRHAIPPSLLISALGLLPEAGRATTSFLKRAGDPIYLAGGFLPSFGGSAYAELYGLPSGADAAVPGPPEMAADVYRSLHAAIMAGELVAAHDLSEGGLALALAEMCMGGRLGARLGLGRLRSADFGVSAAGGTAGGGNSVGGPTASAPELAGLLFGESNGCLLVEVEASSAPAFEARLSGLPLLRLGEVSEGRRLSIRVVEAAPPILDLELEALLAAWKGRGEEVLS